MAATTEPKGKHGGARPGAGRPKNPPQLLPGLPAVSDPLAFLLAVVNCREADTKLRIDAAKAALPFTHKRARPGGKKDDAADAAKKATAGRFQAARAPRLVIDNAG